jgi:Na+/H+ antiporter NhaD/arsenite permease-like protein
VHAGTVIFLVTYALIAFGENSPRKLDRPTTALLGAVLMVICRVLTRAEAAAAVDFSTLALLFGMMVLLEVLTQSGLPARLATKALARCKGPVELLAVVVFSAGIGSALMLNDTVCLLGTPLLLDLAERAGLPSTPYLLALATGSNIGSVMTLTGNPQNMIIGHESGWGWGPFLLRMAPVGLVCLAANLGLLALLYRRTLRRAARHWVLVVAFICGAPMDFAAVATGVGLLVWVNRPPKLTLERVDWSLLLFFAGLFVVVEGFVHADRPLLEWLINGLRSDTSPQTAAQLSAITLIGSNVFSNVPFVLIAGHWVSRMADPPFVWLLLAMASTFAGNLTLFGSVANLIVAQGAQERAPVRFLEFLRVGVPVTFVTTLLGGGMLYLLHLAGWA